MPTLNRREFLRWLTLAGGAAACLPVGMACGDKSTGPSQSEPDIMLGGSETELVETAGGQFNRLWAMAQNPGREVTLGFSEGGMQEVLRMSFVKNKSAEYHHLRVVRQSTGEAANLLWGLENFLPAIKLVDDSGRALVKNGREIAVDFASTKIAAQSQSIDLLELGAKVAIIALAIWLGAAVGKAVLAAIGFIAFNAMVLGLVVLALGALSPLLEKIRDVTGWQAGDVKAFMEAGVERLKEFFGEARQLLDTLLITNNY